MTTSKKYFITSTTFMAIGLSLIVSSIILYAFYEEKNVCTIIAIVASILSLIFFGLGSFFLYKYDQEHTEKELPPRILPSLTVLIIFIIGEICLIYYLATKKFIDFNSSISFMLISGIILELIVIIVSSVMFISGIKEYLIQKNK